MLFMAPLEQLLGMIITEAVEGQGISEDHPDETNILYHNRPEQYQPVANLSPIRYDLELIKKKDGSLEWIE